MTSELSFNEAVVTFLQTHAREANRLVLAFSGGLDSCALLHILSSAQLKQNLLVWHVNHGLQDCAGDMESFCANIARSYNIDFKVSHLSLDNKQSNLEALARKGRYAMFEQGLAATDILLTAHHADDQAETFFINQLRGAGSAGLSGIARSRPLGKTKVLRPLLDISRGSLEQYARQYSLDWFEDPSNQSERFDRNYLRRQVLPLLKTRWPGFLKSIRRVCDIQSETQQLLDEVGGDDLQQCRMGWLSLCQDELTNLSVSRQKNVIRFWLRQNNFESLPTGRLDELIKQLNADEQAHPLIQTWQYEIRIYHRRVYLVLRQNLPVLEQAYNLNNDEDLAIESIVLLINRKQVFERFKLTDQGQDLSIRFRSSGKVNPEFKHRLKRLYQKYHVQPWLRDQTPQIYIDGELRDLWVG